MRVSGMGAGEAEASTGALVSLRLWEAALRFRRTLVSAQYLDSWQYLKRELGRLNLV